MSSKRDIAISYINSLRHANCQALVMLMNTYWSKAAFNNDSLDCKNIVHLSRQIKDNATSILKVRRDLAMCVSWEEVKLKRSDGEGSTSPCAKRRRI